MSSLRLALKESLKGTKTSTDEEEGEEGEEEWDGQVVATPVGGGEATPKRKRGRPRKDEGQPVAPPQSNNEDRSEALESQGGASGAPEANSGSSAVDSTTRPTPVVSTAPTQDDAAANAIQQQWKKKRKQPQQTVPEPSPELIEHQRTMEIAEARQAVALGLRVKVRFTLQEQGAIHQWYGGRVANVSKERTKIRIKYDDGKKENAHFPDVKSDIVIDDTGNGQHEADATAFMPKNVEETSLRVMKKKKKRKLEEDEVDADTPVVRSGRRAAQQANERIVNKAPPSPVDLKQPHHHRRRRGGGNALDTTNTEETQVQCDRCKKWRYIPRTAVATLPSEWYCADNMWDPKRADCDVPEQDAKERKKYLRKRRRREEAEGGLDEVADEGVRRGRGRPRRAVAQAATSAAQKEDDNANVEWVCCEKCNKWRKLPPHISASDLPDVWYCSMNTWNVNLSCDDPEDKADGLQDVVSPFASAGAMTYRNLIFGSTGRKMNRPISERTRAAESIFGMVDDLVMYANHSAFVSRSRGGVPSTLEEVPGPSVFDIMSCSNLWSHLGQTPLLKNQTFDTLPETMKEPLKELLVQVLGEETMTMDDVVKAVAKQDLTGELVDAKPLLQENVVITALTKGVQEGKIQQAKESWDGPAMFRRARELPPPLSPSRCMKRSKPWKLLST